MSDCYCRKLSLVHITTDLDLVERIQSLVLNTNHVVRESYQFLRFYFIYLYDNNKPFPVIDRSLLKLIFSIISDRRKSKPKKDISHVKDDMVEFYNKHYVEIQHIRVKAPPKDILDPEADMVKTNVENHIKGSFFNYVRRLAFSMCPNKGKQESLERRKIRNDLFHAEDDEYKLTSPDKYHDDIKSFSADIKSNSEVLFSNPQYCLPLMFRICKYIESKGIKQLAWLPLRRSLIPCYISIGPNNFKHAFGDILKARKVDLWKNIKDNIESTVKHKFNFVFTSMKTDGIACSLLFQNKETKGWGKKKSKNKKAEQYFEDLKFYDEFKDKKIVAIDPNKGNLVYCFDGINTLRYTQDERRKVSRKTKYRKIRNEKEDVWQKWYGENNFKHLKDEMFELKDYNSRSSNFNDFKLYIQKKNEFASRYSDVYEENIFRKLKWNTKINLTRNEDEFVNRFKSTYGTENVVIVFGDWEERVGFLKGKEPTKGKSMRNMFKRAGYKVYLLDEFRTSKVCHRCDVGTNETQFVKRIHPHPNKRDRSQKVWGILRCTNGNCRRIHNRDFNSANNILKISLHIINTGVKPSIFERKRDILFSQTCAPSLQDG